MARFALLRQIALLLFLSFISPWTIFAQQNEQLAATKTAPQQSASPTLLAQNPPTTPLAIPQTPPPPRWYAILDAGHGGTDPGGHLSEKLVEKDFNLQIARKLRLELQNRGINVFMLRDSDNNPTLEQRALAANSLRFGFYIGIHASLSGSGVHIYQPLLSAAEPYANKEQEEAEKKSGPFRKWNDVQRPQLERSHLLALEIATQLKQHDLRPRLVTAAVRPMSNIAMPAVVIEISPIEAGGTTEKMMSAAYQQAIVQALAAAIQSLHGPTEEVR